MTEEGIDTSAWTSGDPVTGLRAIAALRRLADRLEAIHIANARKHGMSWAEIADALGVTRQAVHQRFGRGPHHGSPHHGSPHGFGSEAFGPRGFGKEK